MPAVRLLRKVVKEKERDEEEERLPRTGEVVTITVTLRYPCRHYWKVAR